MACMRKVAGLISLIFLTTTAWATPALENAGVWERCADVPWRVQEVYGAGLDGKLIIAGGMAPSAEGPMEALGRTGIYDPESDTWAEGASLPRALHHPLLVTAGGRVYAFGGFTSSPAGFWNASREVYVLDSGDLGWSSVTQMPDIQMEAMIVEHEGRVHIIGGRAPVNDSASRWNEYRDVDWHQVYDIASNRWSKAAPLPSPRNSAAVAIIDGLIYVAGGRTMKEGNTADLHRYDPLADSWKALASMPYAGGGINGAAAGGHFYVFGGEELGVRGAEGVMPHAVRYDPAADQWQTLPNMPTPRHGHAVVAIAGTLFTIGGGAHTSGGLTTAVLEAFHPAAESVSSPCQSH